MFITDEATTIVVNRKVSGMKALWLVVVLVAVFGCNENPVSPSDLKGATWRLVLIERAGTPLITVLDPSRYTIQFLENERVSVRADCNTCGGSYALTGTAFSTGALACTKAFCGATSLDGAFVEGLASARSLARKGSRLTIRSDGTTLQLRND